MKWILKWLFRLVLAAVVFVIVAVIVLLLSYNSIIRVVLERQIRAQTGMDAEIGRFHLALTAPTVELQDFKLYNTPAFGGTLFLDIPEIHAEYDPAAFSRREFHLTLLRFNLGELDIVKNQAGQTNLFLPHPGLAANKSGGGTNALADFQKKSGYAFTGIDTLNVSFGKVKFIDLQDQRNDREQVIGLDNVVIPHVKSEADLFGLAADIALHSNGFFDAVFGPKTPGLNALRQLGL